MRCLWDTSILSDYLKRRDAALLARAAKYLNQHGEFSISTITRWETLRGLRWKKSPVQLMRLAAFCRQNQILALTDRIIDLAADLWADLQRTGQPIGDNDILIAATALHHGLALATRNLAHFHRVPGLTLDDWTHP